MKEQDTIIIGAGVTGLAAAYKLSRQGKRVLVIESDDRIGGLLSSYDFGDYRVERFYHHFFAYDIPLMDLVKDLGLEEEISWKKASTGYYYQGMVYNLDTPREIFLYKHLSFFDKFRLAFAVLRIKRMKEFRSLDRVTAKEWLLKYTGRGVYNNFFAPLLKSKFGSAADQISAAWLCARLKLRSNRKVSGELLGYFTHGFDVLLDRMRQEIEKNGEIITGHKVTEIFHTDQVVEGVKVGEETYSAPTVIATMAPHHLLSLTTFPPEYQAKLEKNRSQSVVCALFGMKKPLLNTYWLNIRSETLPFALLIEHTNFHDIPEYKGQKILYVAGYQDGPEHPMYQLPDEEILERYLAGLESEFQLDRDNIIWQRLTKAPAVGPIYSVHFLDNLLPHETGIAGLYLGGMMTSYPERGISASLEQGYTCADLALG